MGSIRLIPKRDHHIDGCHFGERVASNCIRHVVNVTIESARDFDDCRNIYVHYMVDMSQTAGDVLPAGRELDGVTHQSRAGNDGEYHFGVRFTLDVSTTWQRQVAVTAEPLLLLQVYDVNMWSRQRSVGYGFAHVPMAAGCWTTSVPTWRPQPTSTLHQLHDHFLGLSADVDQLKYAGFSDLNVKESSQVMCRYPFASQTAGSVRIRFDTIVQKGDDVVEEQNLFKTKKRPTSSTVTNTVDRVIESYHRARNRLKAAHDALLPLPPANM